MLGTLVKRFFGSRNERLLRRMQGVIGQINAQELTLQALSDEQLQQKTAEFRQRLQQGEALDALLPEAFAVVREASVRTLGMRHFDVQLIGGMVLHEGNIAEMRTGEGKTLMSTLSAYLNALAGKGVHIVTVNDYLAQRDRDWMFPIFDFLGMTVSVNLANLSHEEKQQAYRADIIYGTNNEFGFDYLRDNMAFSLEEKVQGMLNYAIVDEVDSILIDEARTPLIISGAAEDSSALYKAMNRLIPQLKQQQENSTTGDYTIDEKQRQVYLTESGHQHVEQLLVKENLLSEDQSLYSAANISLMHHVGAALRAHVLFKRDVDYIVKDNQVVIVDEHTGRTMPGRRWSEGLHQAVEAKEGTAIQNENQTLASTTFQNYFRIYNKLAGMTGTADTEAYEFQQIYNLEVVVIPTNRQMVRDDMPDHVYLNQRGKFNAIIDDIKQCCKQGQPVLVGTASIETSEYLSGLLNKEKVNHQVLNAKFHQKEASIIAEAGRPGVITIATNMAGRGTDIVLGGSLEAELNAMGDDISEQQREQTIADWKIRHRQVIDAGGLRIVGSERHESRRIDNQLRGRAGRQGDPGSSRFYLSLEDNLMRIFASERVATLMKRFGMEENDPIEHSWVTKAIENAQRKVEGHNFDIRKQLLEYDNVANEQRQAIYSMRTELMASDNLSDVVEDMRTSVIEKLVEQHIPPQSLEEQWDITALEQQLLNDFALKLPLGEWLEKEDNLDEEAIRQRITAGVAKAGQEKEQQVGAEVMRQLEKSIMLQTLDMQWRDHLVAMDHLRQGIHLRGYAQKDPKQEFKLESFQLFSSLLDNIKYHVVSVLNTIEVQAQEDVAAVEQQRRSAAPHQMDFQHPSLLALDEESAALEAEGERPTVTTYTRSEPKLGRNDPCHCGSGKKFKHCHGRL